MAVNENEELYYLHDVRLFVVTVDNGDDTYDVRLIDKDGSAVGPTYVAGIFAGQSPSIAVSDIVACAWMYDGDDKSTRTLKIVSAPTAPSVQSSLYLAWYKVTAVNAGPTFDVKAVYADGNTYGATIAAVTVFTGHSSALAASNIILGGFVPASGADPTLTLKLFNFFAVNTN